MNFLGFFSRSSIGLSTSSKTAAMVVGTSARSLSNNSVYGVQSMSLTCLPGATKGSTRDHTSKVIFRLSPQKLWGLSTTAPSSLGNWCHIFPSRIRPPDFEVLPPHCLKKNGTFLSALWSLTSRTQSGLNGLKFGPDSPSTITQCMPLRAPLVEPDYYTRYQRLGLQKLSSYHKSKGQQPESI